MNILQPTKYVLLFSFLFLFSCTKEVTDDLLITFKVTAPTETLNSFVNVARPFEVSIRGINAHTSGSYRFTYAIDSGAGYLRYRGSVIEQDAPTLLSGSANELEFVGTEIGNVTILLTILDSKGEEKTLRIHCNVQETAFTFSVTPSATAVTPNNSIDLVMTINEINPSTYKTKYEVLPADQGTVEGSGTVLINSTALPNNTFTNTQSGQFTWQFMGDELGPVRLKFTTENGFGVIAEQEITIQVSETEIPAYTFTAVAASDLAADINQPLGIDFNLTESTGTSTYTMTFTSTNEGSLLINNTIFETGDTITAGDFTGAYTGTEAGDHTLTFTVQNAFDPPLEQTATVSFTYTDPASDTPTIILGGTGDTITLCQGEAFEDPMSALAADGTVITDQVSISINPDSFGDYGDPNAGSYIFEYTLTDAETVSRTVQINQAPSFNITATPSAGNAPLNVQFALENLVLQEGATITDYLWDFADMNATSTAASPEHTYNNANEDPYTVVVTATDSNGCQHKAKIDVQVNPSESFVIANSTPTTTITESTNTPVPISFDIVETPPNQSRTYAVTIGTNQTGTIVYNGTSYNVPHTIENASAGSIAFEYTGSNEAAHEVSVMVATDGLTDQTTTVTINYETNEIPFTFTASADPTEIFIAETINFNLDINQTGTGITNYSIRYEISGTGEGRVKDQDGNEIAPSTSTYIDINEGSNIWTFEGTKDGNADITFYVRNESVAPEESSSLSILIKPTDFSFTIEEAPEIMVDQKQIAIRVKLDQQGPEIINYQMSYSISQSSFTFITYNDINNSEGSPFEILSSDVDNGEWILVYRTDIFGFHSINFTLFGNSAKTQSLGLTVNRTDLNYTTGEYRAPAGSSVTVRIFTEAGLGSATIKDNNDIQINRAETSCMSDFLGCHDEFTFIMPSNGSVFLSASHSGLGNNFSGSSINISNENGESFSFEIGRNDFGSGRFP